MEKIPSETPPLKQQLQWLLMLRVVFYTLLLGLNFLFSASNLEVIVLPPDYLLLFILLVYIITVGSAFILKNLDSDPVRFGLIQTLLDTIFVSILIYYTGASHSTFVTLYFFPIVAGGLILPRRGGFAAAASASIQFAIILALEYVNIFPAILEKYRYMYVHDLMATFNHFSVKGLSFFLAAILSAIFGRRLVKAEQALTHTQQSYEQLNILYKLVFDNITTGIITLDDQNRITSANNAFEKITGYGSHDIYLKSVQEVFPTLILQTANERHATEINRKDGSSTRVGYAYAMFFPENALHIKYLKPHKIVTLQDISEVERLEQKIRQAEKLAAIGMMSASIAHEFRNPLTAIFGSAQVLSQDYAQRRNSVEKTHYDLTEIIIRESKRMTETITNFLRFARPEETKHDWFSLKNCLDEIIQTFKMSQHLPQSFILRSNIPETLEIWGDKKQLTVVFKELIDNSLAFCPEGNEFIEISAKEISIDGKPHSTITLSDNGSGIEPEASSLIFEPFYTSRADGTGLGLTIVNQTIENHNGAMTIAQSQFGGASFTLILPCPEN